MSRFHQIPGARLVRGDGKSRWPPGRAAATGVALRAVACAMPGYALRFTQDDPADRSFRLHVAADQR